MTPEPSIMSDSGSQAVICHLVYGTWAWLSRFPLLDDNPVDGVVEVQGQLGIVLCLKSSLQCIMLVC
ncbi:unnamed protein product [Sphagnum jensenii]|uniref:Uncharacterized protein n=1 Tax=Sphagnum jensenii TaxID=128206 RepID=A0ABP1B0F4_9BRYO